MHKFLLNYNAIEVVEDVCPLPGTGQNRPLPLLLPPHIQIKDDSQWWSLPHMEKFQKLFLLRGLSQTSFLSLLLLLFVLNFLPQPLQTNTWLLWFQTLCFLGVGKDLKALSQTLQG